MIKDNDDFDIYNITESQYNYDILETMLNLWNMSGYPDIITEYFGNTSYFEPSLEGFVDMLQLITERRNNFGLDTPLTLFNISNTIHTYCDVLRHYAYHYIDSLGYENFKLKLKDYIYMDE